MPRKQAVMQLMDVLDAEAVKARAVNTIVYDDERLVGSNTDIAAIRAAISSVGPAPRGANVVIFGAGGAARGAAGAVEGAHVPFASRHPGQADRPGRALPLVHASLHGL